MARTRMGLGKTKRRKTLFHGEPKPWADLHSDLLFKIFSYLDPDDLIVAVSMVCKSWRQACWEVLFRKNPHTLDLAHIKPMVRSLCWDTWPWYAGSDYRERFLQALESTLASPLEQGQELITTLVFPPNMHVPGLEESTFLAERTPNLKRLVLPDASELRHCCFSEALKHWKFLEEMSIGSVCTHHMRRIIKNLGINCKNLSRLEINITVGPPRHYFILNPSNADLIAKHLVQLKEFSMTRCEVRKTGVSVMLKECKQIMRLCFNSCCPGPSIGFVNGQKVYFDKFTQYCVSLDLKKEVAIGNEDVKWSPVGSGKGLMTSDQVLRHFFRNL